MRFTTASALTLAAALSSTAHAINIQSPNARGDADRANAVASSFSKSFADYKANCWGRDEMRGLSGGCDDPLGGWGATLVDALSTAKVMGLQDVFDDAVRRVAQTDYTKTKSKEVSLFETNIRHLGGLLSAYDLNGKKDQVLLEQAQVVGSRLLRGWVGNNPIPYNTLLEWNAGPNPNTSTIAILAEPGTLILEFDRLSKFTGNDTYIKQATRAMQALVDIEPTAFPGLPGMGVEPKTGKPAGTDLITWGGGTDSYFEYLAKYAHLIGSADTWAPAWVETVQSSIEHLLIAPPGGTDRKNTTWLADFSQKAGGVIPRYSHLGCFAGGNWLLGGKLLGNDKIFNYGLSLADSCISTYTASASGLGPGYWSYKTADGKHNRVNITDEAFYKEHGFNYYNDDFKYYGFGPEVLESVFYAYRLTGDKRWQDVAWRSFQALLKHTSSRAALAPIEDVSSPNPKQADDSAGSYLYAELYKYLYLIFAEPSNVDLGTYVFNTEGHPFHIDNPDFVLAGQVDTSGIDGARPQGEEATRVQANKDASSAVASSASSKQEIPQVSGLGGVIQQAFDDILGIGM